MAIDIFKPISGGKEVFHARSYDADSFVMDWTMEAGGKVPTHVHHHMDEHFLLTKGEALFTVNGEKIRKKEGDAFFVPKGVPHSVTNVHDGQIAMTVTYSPCADVHRMFEILVTLDATDPGSMMNMVKYFYIYPRLGLKEFSAVHPPFVMSIMGSIVTVVGKLSGWDKLVEEFR